MTLESPSTQTIQEEVIDFLLSSPTLEQITEFHASDMAQERLRYLLDANRSNTLTPEELSELDQAEQMDHFVARLKTRAYKVLAEK